MNSYLLLAARLLAIAAAAISTAAQAADLPVKALPPPAVVSWSGLYAGVQGGYFWANSSGTLTDFVGNNPFPWNVSLHNWLGGFHAGYDRQIGPVVVGVEGDIEAAHQDRDVTLPTGTFRFGPNFPNTRFESSMDWTASLRGRVGLPFGKTLVYGTGGFALGDVMTRYFPGGFPIQFKTLTDVRPGWTVGAGVEHAFAPDWTARLEYRYTEFDTVGFRSPPIASDAADQNKFNFHAVRVGVSWRPGFGAGGSASASPNMLFAPLPAARWSGFYGGVHAGGIWNNGNSNLFGIPEQTFGLFTPRVTANLDQHGLLGGVQSGYNYQAGRFVVGLEQDISLTNTKASASVASTFAGALPSTVTESANLEWLASTRARIGYAPSEQWLLYATGGVAYGRAVASTGLTFAGAPQSYFGSRSDVLVGWIAGAGAEYALSDRWSVRAEYLHYDLGGMNVIGLPTIPNPPFTTQGQFNWNGNIVRAGVDYRFGVPALAATATPAFPTKAPLLTKAPQVASAFDTVVGGRYWYSTGRSQKDLHGLADVNFGLVSRISYDKLETHSAETFFRVDHRSGLFVKGFAGLGVMPGGHQNDEDFPPAIVPYSNAESFIRNSRIAYLSADVGYDFVRAAAYRLGVLAGYHYDNEKMNEYGCRQLAASAICNGAGVQSTAALDITDDNRWHSLRLGLNGSVKVADRLTFTGEAVWLPYTRLDATDTHWFRQSSVPLGVGIGSLFGALPEDGVGHNGVQLEAMLDYRITDAFSLGAGARYWRMETSGNMHFEGVTVSLAGGGGPQRLDYTLERYGGFVQGSYKF